MLAFFIFFVIPGFISGYYCKVRHHLAYGYLRTDNRALDLLLYPARKLSELIRGAYQIYRWEFTAAGGKVESY